MNENFKFPHWCGEDCDCNDENGNECPYLNGDDCLLPNDDVEHNVVYNKALDDFIKSLDQHCGYYQGKNKTITRNDVLKIVEI